jgi:hypothetical protein
MVKLEDNTESLRSRQQVIGDPVAMTYSGFLFKVAIYLSS